MLYKIVIPKIIDMENISKKDLEFLLSVEGGVIQTNNSSDDVLYGDINIPCDFLEEVENELEYLKENEKDIIIDFYENLGLALYKIMKDRDINRVETTKGILYYHDLENIFKKGKVLPYLGDD